MLWGQELAGAARANLAPAIALQGFAAFLLWAYYFWPRGHAALDQLAQLKQGSGPVFAFVASAVAGALLPYCFQSLQRGDHRRLAIGALLPLILFWGLRGWLVDAFYLLQTLLWGDNAQPATIAIKIAFDLAVFSPLVAIPSITLMFGLVDCDFDFAVWSTRFDDGLIVWWLRSVLPLLATAWMVWLPSLLVIYALPSGLQFPVQAVVQCFWSLVLVVVTDTAPKASPS